MESTNTYDELLTKLRLSAKGLIAIEGFCSSGKTTLAEQLAKDLTAKVIHVDSYCTPRENPPPYPDGVDISRLKHTLLPINPTVFSIIEGICLRDVLMRCDIVAKTYLYIKKLGSNGLWHDGLHLESYDSGDLIPGDEQEPHSSDLSYHSKTRPHEIANFLFSWIDET